MTVGSIPADCFFIDRPLISAILKSEIENLKSEIIVAPIVQWPRISGSHPGDRGSTPLGGIFCLWQKIEPPRLAVTRQQRGRSTVLLSVCLNFPWQPVYKIYNDNRLWLGAKGNEGLVA